MSTKSSLREAFGQRVGIRAAPRNSGGSVERLRLSVSPDQHYSTPSAALILVRNGMKLKAAHLAMTKLVDTGDIVVELPNVEDIASLKTELKAVGVVARSHSAADLDPKVVRERMNLSQKDFAYRFGLDEATVQNWEQKRSGLPRAARVLLTTIDRYPDLVSSAIEGGAQPKKKVVGPYRALLLKQLAKGKRFRSLKEAKEAIKKQIDEQKKIPSTRKGRGDRGRRYQESA